MSRIRSGNTLPERTVRSLLHGMGLRFRLHRRDLPGTPDIVLPGRRTVIFVHGCFWHHHAGCPDAATPRTRRAFWLSKFRDNRRRDSRNQRELTRLGWKVLTIWECETGDERRLRTRLRNSVMRLQEIRKSTRRSGKGAHGIPADP